MIGYTNIDSEILIFYIDELKPITSLIYFMVYTIYSLFVVVETHVIIIITFKWYLFFSYYFFVFIGSKSIPIDNSILNFQSTCHEALETCNKHSQCQEMVASIIRNCNHRQCKKTNCMESLQNFYRNESMHSYAIEIAFCLCKWVPIEYYCYLYLVTLFVK